jgi:hypothetical protein
MWLIFVNNQAISLFLTSWEYDKIRECNVANRTVLIWLARREIPFEAYVKKFRKFFRILQKKMARYSSIIYGFHFLIRLVCV